MVAVRKQPVIIRKASIVGKLGVPRTTVGVLMDAVVPSKKSAASGLSVSPVMGPSMGLEMMMTGPSKSGSSLMLRNASRGSRGGMSTTSSNLGVPQSPDSRRRFSTVVSPAYVPDPTLPPLPNASRRRGCIELSVEEQDFLNAARALETPARRDQRERLACLADILDARHAGISLSVLERAFLYPEEVIRAAPDKDSGFAQRRRTATVDDSDDSDSSDVGHWEGQDRGMGRPPQRRSLLVRPAPVFHSRSSDADLAAHPQDARIDSWWTQSELRTIRARMRRLKHLRQLEVIKERNDGRKTREVSVAVGEKGLSDRNSGGRSSTARSRNGFGSAKTGRYPPPTQQQPHSQQQQGRRPWTEQTGGVPRTSILTPPRPVHRRLWSSTEPRIPVRPRSADTLRPTRPRHLLAAVEPFFWGIRGQDGAETQRSPSPGMASVFSDGPDVVARPAAMATVPAKETAFWEVVIPSGRDS
ncbi:hypothetical protein HKX48_004868 [Thoreauomyces humboldtii]|nr:hypothetical protein HKX48_004868 [Thoreauomyces humboldtii]